MDIEIKGRGGIIAKVIADSISRHGQRITTVQLRYPRFIHGELMTHRVFSRNAASSRAIPVKKMIEQVRQDPAMPIHWGKNQPGMQANVEMTGSDREDAIEKWRYAAVRAANMAEVMNDMGLHKQVVNRILEPFQFMQTVVTSTEWGNFFDLRIHKDAQPEIQELASCIYDGMVDNVPRPMDFQNWHLPYVSDEEMSKYDLDVVIKCSAARCARVSYLNHDQSEPSIEKDIELYNMLAVRPYDDGKGHVLGDGDPVHLSPLEHQAKPMKEADDVLGTDWPPGVTHGDGALNLWSGNFKGWIQYRQVAS